MIDFYVVPTANGQKGAIMLEESGLDYRAHQVRRKMGAPPPADHLKINPIGKYPTIVDDDGPDGTPISVFETLAIALYLAEKAGRLLPANASERAAAYMWASAANAGLTPMMGTQYFLEFRTSADVSDVSAWILSEVQRHLVAIDQRLGEARYLAGDSYSVADVLTYPVLATSVQRLEGGYSMYDNIKRWTEEVSQRPAVIRGMAVAS